jgi:cell wall-associated NlpC family hydrolase
MGHSASSPIPEWVAEFIGKPFQDRGRGPESYDCYGLLVETYRRIFNIEIPSFSTSYATANDREAVARVFFEESSSARWRRVDLKDAQPPDVLAMSLAGNRHVGVLVTPDRFLHVLPGRETCVERLKQWMPRITAVYRNEALVIA